MNIWDFFGRTIGGLSDRYLGTNWLSTQSAEQAYNRQQDLQNANFQFQERMMDKQNEYNTPSNMMSRLRDAGLNPHLVNGQPVATSAAPSGGSSASAPMAQGANGAGDLISAIQQGAFMSAQKDLLVAQKENLESQTKFNDSKTEYQEYMNKVEAELAKFPVSVTYVNGDPNITYGNYHVEVSKQTLHKLGLDNSLENATLNELLFNIAALTGSDAYGLTNFAENTPSEQPNFNRTYLALQGDQDVRIAAGKIQSVLAEATEAQKKSQAEFNKWLEKNKDNDVVKFALAIVGLLQTLGVSLPSFSYSNGPKGPTTKIGS